MSRKNEKKNEGAKQTTARERRPFPIVGIGASAGGLEALQQFFSRMPADCGMGFVVVLHLSPDQKSLLAELLSKETRMEVVRAEEGARIEPNKVYVIPPRADLLVRGGRLHLVEPELAHGHRQPIDHCLRTLAEDQGENAIGVILSGTGTDGTLGVKAVKAAGGLVVVQEETSARYPGMPRSAIETGVADIVLPVEEIPGKLIEFVSRSAKIQRAEKPQEAREEIADRLPVILKLIRRQTGNDFSSYKTSTVIRRIARRMAVGGLEEVGAYIQLLQERPEEVRALFKDLLISVTSFFRDPEAFEALRQQAVAALVEGGEPGQPIKVWVAGCATGEEAYSVAILFREEMLARRRNDLKVQIFATDLDEAAIETARLGRFPNNIAVDVSPQRLEQFFRRVGDIYQVSGQIREMVVFSVHNMTKDPPFSRLDLVCCRNLLIYLDAPIQKKLLPLFHYALKPGGYLFLGTSETIGAFTELFDTVDKKWKVYRRAETARPVTIDFPMRAGAEPAEGEAVMARLPGEKFNLAGLVERTILQRYAPPSVLIDEKMEVVHFSSRTSRYLEPPVGEPSLNILRMAREELRPALRAAIRKVFARREPSATRGVKVHLDGDKEVINLLVEPLRTPSGARDLALVVFEPAPAVERETREGKALAEAAEREAGEVVKQLEEELRITSEQLQSTIEELETSNEELKSSNEELMSMNEELQSSNEELESSKEELQALNEELTTVNSELEHKVEELADANSDMQNLLNSSQIATVFLDKKLRVRRFTPTATAIFNLIESDVGRPFHHTTSKLERPQLENDAEKVLRTLEVIEREVITAEGQWYIQRILPYRTVQDMIDGVVITLTDITERKKAEEKQAQLAAIVESSQDAIIGKTLDGIITSWNLGAERMYGYTAEEAVGRPVSILLPREKKGEFAEILDKLRRDQRITDFETERITRDGRRICVSLTISPIKDAKGQVIGASTIARDITLSRQAREALQQAKEAAEQADRAKSEFLANVSHEIRTPMTVTLSALEQVLTGDLAEEHRKYLGMAQSASRSLLNLLDEILEISRIEARAVNLAREPFDLHQCVQETVESFSVLAKEKGLTWSCAVDGEVPRIVVGDPDRLRQVLSNLVSNAVKFTDRGGVSVAVSLPPAAPGQHFLLFSVRDTGIGIAKRDIPLLFRTFSQLNGSRIRRFGGVGLGLAISKGLVEKMGGSLQVKSQKGKGSLFSFLLPLPPYEEALPLQETGAAERQAAETRPRPARILLVEDDPQISGMVSALLRQHGWETETAENGIKALETWGTGRFGLILMDLQMPMLDGLQVTRAIRAKEKKKGDHIPILALTAHAGWEDRKACREAGMDGFLAKPVATAELLAEIERQLAAKGKKSEGGEET